MSLIDGALAEPEYLLNVRQNVAEAIQLSIPTGSIITGFRVSSLPESPPKRPTQGAVESSDFDFALYDQRKADWASPGSGGLLHEEWELNGELALHGLAIPCGTGQVWARILNRTAGTSDFLIEAWVREATAELSVKTRVKVR